MIVEKTANDEKNQNEGKAVIESNNYEKDANESAGKKRKTDDEKDIKDNIFIKEPNRKAHEEKSTDSNKEEPPEKTIANVENEENENITEKN